MILPDTSQQFEQSQAAAIKIADAYKGANFCTFSYDGLRKIPKKKGGAQGVGRDTPPELLLNSDDVYFTESLPSGDYFGLVLQKAAALPQGHLVVLDVDLKHSETTTNIAIKRLAKWVHENQAMTEISVSGKGRHVFLIANSATDILPKYKLAAGQEIEIFGLDNSAGKSVLLSGTSLTGNIVEVPDLHALLSDLGIIEQHNLNQPAPKPRTEYKPTNHSDDYNRASTALNFISPDVDYNDWIGIGQALHTAFGNQGKELWGQWSSQGSKFIGEKDINTHWKSFHQGKGIALGTLFHMAKEAGYQPMTKAVERLTAVQDFAELIKSQPQTNEVIDQPTQSTQPELQGWPELTLDLSRLHPIEYMIQGFWAHSFFVLAGQPGVGKTTAVISACMVMAGFKIGDCTLTTREPRKAIFVTEDSDQIKRTLFAYAKHYNIPTADLLNWFVVIDAKRSDIKDLLILSHNIIRHTVNGIRPHLILDTANSTMDIENENDNSEVGSFMAALKQTIYVQLHAPITVITHLSKTISRQDSDATARGASAFTGDATLTGILFMDDDGTRFMKLTKTRYEPDFREIRFDSHLFAESVVDQHGEIQQMLCRVAIPHESSESTRKQDQATRTDDKRQQAVQDAADSACNFVQSVINTHTNVIIRKGAGRPAVPPHLAGMHQLEWSDIYQSTPNADQSYSRKAVGNAVFQRFDPHQSQAGWVQLF